MMTLVKLIFIPYFLWAWSFVGFCVWSWFMIPVVEFSMSQLHILYVMLTVSCFKMWLVPVFSSADIYTLLKTEEDETMKVAVKIMTWYMLGISLITPWTVLGCSYLVHVVVT